MTQNSVKKYRHLFFDLDHTLWDFERNANECLQEIYEKFGLSERFGQLTSEPNSLSITRLDDFLLAFDAKNRELWSLLDKHLITHLDLRKRRFKETLEALGIEVEIEFSQQLNEEFLLLLPKKSHLIEGAKSILDYLFPRYQLHIITNGFDEIQGTKMRSAEIEHYFGEIITNEKANARKPDKEIFEFSLKITNAQAEESLMIGDNYEADILGATAAKIDTVFYNPDSQEIKGKKPTFEIKYLMELEKIL